MNLIKESQDLRNRGKIEAALKAMERTLEQPDFSNGLDPSVQRELHNKKLEFKTELLKWDQVATELLSQNEGCQLHEIASSSGFKQVDMMIRS